MAVIGYWALNGNSNDSSGNGHNGSDTSISYTTGSTTTPFSYYATFNGSSSKIVIGNYCNPGTGDFTVDYWVKFASSYPSLGVAEIITKNGYDVTGYRALQYNGSLYSQYSGAASVAFSDTTSWHHVIMTRQYGAVNEVNNLYVDGTLLASNTTTAHQNMTNTQNLVFGCLQDSTNTYFRYWQGSLAEIKISDTFYDPTVTGRSTNYWLNKTE